MITPNKFISFDKSILCKLEIILSLSFKNIDIIDLYKQVEIKFESINDFILTMDVLYVLDCIEIDFNTRKLTYVKRNSL